MIISEGEGCPSDREEADSATRAQEERWAMKFKSLSFQLQAIKQPLTRDDATILPYPADGSWVSEVVKLLHNPSAFSQSMPRYYCARCFSFTENVSELWFRMRSNINQGYESSIV